MALFKIAKGSASNLSTSTISKKPVEGYCWFTTDDGRFYIDTSTSTNNAVIGTNRIAINGVHTASNSWTAGSSAGPTLSITINDITSTAAAIPSASATASGIVTTGNQTFAGRKTMDLISPSVYDGTGDTSRYRRIYFKNNSGTAVGNIRYDSGNATNVTAGQFTFFEYSPKETPDTGNNGHTEAYSLPNVTSGLTTDKSYKIITTKNPEDLGYYLPLSGGTMTGTVKLVSGSSVYAEGNPMFYWLSGSTSSYQKQAAIFTTASTVNSKKVCDRMYFREYSYNSTTGAAIEYWDQYRLPVVTADKTSSDSYEILTSKSAVTIAQGGTSATTAGAAANNLLLGLPTWTANPTDDTYFIRRDTAGGDAFGQVKASTLYNYIAGKTTVSNTWTAGTTAGPTIKTTVNGVAGTAVAIPSASKTASGIVTTGDQYFNGTKGFGYMARYGRTNTGAATRWVADTWLYNDAGTQVGEFWYDCGDATNITTGQYVLSQYSPNSTANTSTTGKKENYKLPVVTSGLTENKNYTIITTKNPADLGYYLPLTGGTLSGDITIAKTGEPALIVNNTSDHKAGFIIGSSSKYAGLWDYTNSKWIVYSTTAGAVTLNGNASTATLPLGFSSQSTNATWGNTTGTTVTAWNDSSGGSIDFRKDNPSSGKLSIKVDGRFYGNEGTYPAMLMNYNNGYWGLGSDPDGGYSGWVRAPASGILTSAKNASSVGSGVGAIGAIEWRFAHVYADTLHGNAETATKANGLVDGSSTMTSAYNKAGLAYGDYTWLAGWNGYELRAVAKTQFAQASHTHSYLPLTGGTLTGNLTAPVYLCNAGSWQKIELIHADTNAQSAGWYRTCVVSARHDYADFLLSLTGGWNNGAPSVALLHICMRNGQAKIAILHGGFTGRITQVRLVKNATNTAYLDLYLSATSSSTAALCGNFLGNVTVSDVATTNTITTSTENVLDTVNLSSYNFQINGTGKFTSVYGAVWNDYAEFRITKNKIEPGRCVIETGKDDLVLSTERLQPGAEIVSDTFGFAIGETDEAKTPIAATGRVLAYIYEGREAALAAIGKPVCSGPDGTVSIMTDEEYQKYGYCAIGTISAVPDYEEWGTENIKVNNRIWIRIR